MKNNKIEINILFFFVIRAVFLLYFFYYSLINLLLSSVITIILITIYNKLSLKKNIFFKCFLLAILLFLSPSILNKITSFIEFNILKNYSPFIIAFSLIIVSLYMAIKGYHTLIKSLELSLYFILFLSLLSVALLLNYINLNNFNLLTIHKELILSSSLIKPSIAYFLIYIMLDYLNNYKITYKMYFLTIINTLFIKIMTISILGSSLTYLYKYPYINVLKSIKYLDFIERMEGLLSLQYLFDFVFLLTLFLLTIKLLIKDIMKIKKPKIINIILRSIVLLVFILKLTI